MAVRTDLIEGVIDEGRIWFHYDLGNDVLYLRLADDRDTPALGQEADDGLIVLRAEADDRAIGLTVVNWWQQFGEGDSPDSLHAIESRIEPWTERIAA